MKTILVLCLCLFSMGVFAEGDKIKNPWQTRDVLFVPEGYTIEDCQVLVEQSGKSYLCDFVVEKDD